MAFRDLSTLKKNPKLMTDDEAREPVRLRKKPISGGGYSLYLDIYDNGKRAYEFLRLYLIPETAAKAKEQNAETMRLAYAIKARRVLEVQSGRYGMKKMGDTVTLMTAMQTSRVKRKGTTAGVWDSAIAKLKEYLGNQDPKLSVITPEWVEEWREWLTASGITANSAVIYDSKIKAALTEAKKRGVIERSPYETCGAIKKEETERQFLTEAELKRLAATPCAQDVIKRAFLFSCLTGLRISDIKALTWDMVDKSGAMPRITFRQKKTSALTYLDITQQAAELMGGEGKPFELDYALISIERAVAKWVQDAGIDKHITFHCARHTFATLMLTKGVDIYTVSKLLGHRSVSTTQIYAKVIDAVKTEAVKKLPKLPI